MRGQERGSRERGVEGRIGKQLVDIWQQVFEVDADHIDPEESLFEIGGTSLQAVRLMTRIEETFGVRIELPVVFAEGSVSRLTELVEEELLASLDGLTEDEARLLLREETERSG